ncbi:MAG: hypothetical protein M1831_007542 [Alyxoria varia]|nr:MAG: hypothetical protein M1831_007542 [Alyxoria varia]
MSDKPLKLKLSTTKQSSPTNQSSAGSPPAQKLKLFSSKPKTPSAASPPPAVPAPPAPKPQAKTTGRGKAGGGKKRKVETDTTTPAKGKKRARDTSADENDNDINASEAGGSAAKRPRKEKPPLKIPTSSAAADKPPKPLTKTNTMIKLNPKSPFPKSATTPTFRHLKIKSKKKPLPRPPGTGYDSEAEDVETDPAIEENIILRMAPGPDADFLREAIHKRRLGASGFSGEVQLRWFDAGSRRAVLNIRGSHYAAVLVDLPCIIESMKSWDRRGFWKSADVSQMLLVIGKVAIEEEAKTLALPPEVDETTWQYPHGLTPPMHNVRNRRFRSRLNYKEVEAAEAEVDELLRQDARVEAQGGDSRWAIMHEGTGYAESDSGSEADGIGDYDEDLAAELRQEAREGEEEVEDMVEAESEEGEEDEEEEESSDEDEDAGAPTNEDELLRMMGEDVLSTVQADASAADTSTGAAGTPAEPAANTTTDPTAAADDESSSSDEDSSDADEANPAETEEARERARLQAEHKEEIDHLQGEVSKAQVQLSNTRNMTIRGKLEKKILSLSKDLANMKRQWGFEDEDEEGGEAARAGAGGGA